MENRIPEMNGWIAAVLENAGHALTRLEGFNASGVIDFYDYEHEPFWLDVPPPPGHDGNYWGLAGMNFSQFNREATLPEKKEFVKRQVEALCQMNNEILSIRKEPVSALKEISRDRRIEAKYLLKNKQKYPDALFRHIHKNRDLFDANPALHFITRFSDFAWDAVKKQDIVRDMLGLSRYLSGFFYRDFNVDLNPGKIRVLLNDMVDRYALMADYVSEKKSAAKQAEKPVIPANLVDPDRIAAASDARADFVASTQRPVRGNGCSSGGRAGWGGQKPDLWRPR